MDGEDRDNVKLDADLNECSICCEALSQPTFQCTAGHPICSPCHEKLPRDCGTCSLHNLFNSAITLQKIAESAAFPCRNTKYGCRRFLSVSEIQHHGNTCNYLPCYCPKEGCSFEGPKKKLMSHLAEHYSVLIHYRVFKHDTLVYAKLCSTIDLTFLHSDDDFLYLIIRKDTALGWAVSVICIRPPEATEPELWYELSTLKCEGEFRLKTRVESTTLKNGFPRDKHFLLIPSELCSSGSVEMIVCIGERN